MPSFGRLGAPRAHSAIARLRPKQIVYVERQNAVAEMRRGQLVDSVGGIAALELLRRRDCSRRSTPPSNLREA